MRTRSMSARNSLSSKLAPNAARRRLMVVERGASAFTRESAEQFDETVAIAQLRSELPAEFAERCLQRLATAERSGRGFDAAMLFTGSDPDEAASAARRLIALGIAAHAEATSLSELVVMTASASSALRDQLIDLVDELLLSGERKALPVRLCFAQPTSTAESDSGVFWTMPETPTGEVTARSAAAIEEATFSGAAPSKPLAYRPAWLVRSAAAGRSSGARKRARARGA